MRDTSASSGNDKNRDQDRAAFWQPRETPVARSVAQYSRFVALMKIALPAAAGFLLLLVIALPQLRQDEERYRIDTELSEGESGDNLSMTNARYYGTDAKGQPYSVVANGVRQRASAEEMIELAGPAAEINMSDGRLMSATAKEGLYDRGQQKLNLSGEVAVSQQNGYAFTTSSALVDLEEGSASGTGPVSGKGPLGTLEAANGFDLVDSGRTVKFRGPARLVLTPEATAKKEPAPARAGAPQK